MRNFLKNQQSGSVLVAILIMMPFFLLITTSYLNLTTVGYKIAYKDLSRTNAQFATDAGVDYAMEKINQDITWMGTGVSEVEVHPNDGRGKSAFVITVTDIDSRNKTLVSEGRYYKSSNLTTPENTVRVSVNIRGVESGGFSIVSGVGGLVMSNSAKIVSGNVYINGDLTMSNTAQIGLSIEPVDVKVAHQSCPLPANPLFNAEYPRVCASGENGQPITLNTSAHIYGEVRATNQTNGSGMTDTGLVTGGSAATIPLPTYDRDAQKTAAIPPVAPYNTNWSCNSGNVIWPANLKIAGNVTISNSCQVTVEGNIWITGNLIMRNSSSKLIVKNGLTAPPVVMIDGASGVNMRNSSEMKSNSDSIGFRVITYASAAGCSPDCADVTGTALYNSRNLITIDLDQSASGPNTEYYARWSKLTAGNSGSIGALAAQTVDLKNSLAVTFGANVTGTIELTWIIDGYKRVFE